MALPTLDTEKLGQTKRLLVSRSQGELLVFCSTAYSEDKVICIKGVDVDPEEGEAISATEVENRVGS